MFYQLFLLLLVINQENYFLISRSCFQVFMFMNFQLFLMVNHFHPYIQKYRFDFDLSSYYFYSDENYRFRTIFLFMFFSFNL